MIIRALLIIRALRALLAIRAIRAFRAILALALACVGVSAAAQTDAAAAPEFVEGVHYARLPVPVETADPNRIEVVEVFLYSCVHCYRLEPMLDAWPALREEDVDFRRLPLTSERSPSMMAFAQAYFTAETLDVLPLVHMPIFTAIHEHGLDREMSRPAYLRRLFVGEAKVAEEEFDRVFNSFGVRSRVRQADGQSRMYRIHATPTLVVNGRYTVEAGAQGGTAGMLLAATHLIEKERAAAKARAQEGRARPAQ